MEKKQKVNTILIIGMIACITMTIIMAVLWITSDGNNNGTPIETTGSEDNSIMKIETPFCDLSYPIKWADNLRHEGKTEDGVYTHTFYSVIDGKETKLFNIYFGAKDKGSLIGYVLKDGNSVAFNVESYDVFTGAELNDDENMILSAMLDGINTVIDSVIASPDYIG